MLGYLTKNYLNFNESLPLTVNSRTNRSGFFTASLWLITSQPSFAAELATLNEIQVNADQPIESRLDNLFQTAVFERKLATIEQKADLFGSLRGTAGVFIGQSNASTTGNLVLRGAGGGFGLVSLDGVPLFSSFIGAFPLSHFPIDFFDSVSFEHAQAINPSGSRTLGGSINLQTRHLNENQGFLHSEAGSYATLRNNLGQGFKTKLGNFSIMAGRTDIFEGISQANPANGGQERDGFQMSNAVINWQRQLSDLELNSSVYYVKNRDDFDGPGLLSNRKLGWKDDANGWLTNQTWVAQTSANASIHQNWQSLFRIGFNQDQQEGFIGNIQAKPRAMYLTSRLISGHWLNTHSHTLNQEGKQTLQFNWGLDGQQQYGDSPYQANHVYSQTDTLISPLAKLQLSWQSWLTSLDWRNDIHDKYGSHTVLSLRESWQARPNVNFYAQVANGFRAPAVNERLHPLFGSVNLKPEQSLGGEVGINTQINTNTDIGLSSYFQRYQDLIIQEQSAITGALKPTNIAHADVVGVELKLKTVWNDSFSQGLNYAFMDAINTNSHKTVAYRPAHQGKIWNQFKLSERISWSLDINYRDTSWADNDNTLKMSATYHINSQIDYKLNSMAKVYLRAENINNNRNAEIYGFNYLGASVYGGANWQW